MGEVSTARATITCFIALVLVTGFTVAPAAALHEDDPIDLDTDDSPVDVDDDGSIEVDDDGTSGVLDHDDDDEEDEEEEDTVPEEVCTDVAGDAVDEFPWENVPWVSDLPDEAQPPGLPWSVITHEAVARIVVGLTPSQCEVWDPNDPPFDPTDPPSEPDADAGVDRHGEYMDGYLATVSYDATLNESGEGPGTSGSSNVVVNPHFGNLDPVVAVNDGEKDYAVDPQVVVREDGSGYAHSDVWMFNQRAGVGVDCDGQVCEAGLRGIGLVPAAEIPAPTGDNEDDEEGDGICTDVPAEIADGVPWDDVPWISDLPDEAQPPGLPWDVITPRAAAMIVVGVTPTQCEVWDPEDPPFDPTDPPSEPDADAGVDRHGEYMDGYLATVSYDATLNESGEGPGTSGSTNVVVNPHFGNLDPVVAVNDGEKDYAVDPQAVVREDGSGYAHSDVWMFNQRAGVGVDCDGQVCEAGLRGIGLVPAVEVPAPTGEDDEEGDGICTDVQEEAVDGVPWEDVPWLSDLPDEAQPPGLPWSVITHEAAARIVVGLTPSQCEVWDPNDPPFDPTDPPSEPDADGGVDRHGEYYGGYLATVSYDATLNESGEGPGTSGSSNVVVNTHFANLDPVVTANDGEKDYSFDPQVVVREDGTGYAYTDVWMFNQRLGVQVDCDGDSCEASLRGMGLIPAIEVPPPDED